MLLASADNPGNATDVFALYNQMKTAGNFNWIDDSGDGIQEPLLDVSDPAIFNPVLVPGRGGGGPNTAPTVSITSPANGTTFAAGASVSFADPAMDAEDGNLTTALAWIASIDGPIGTGGSFSAVLSEGTHTITASVTGISGLTGSASITLMVQTAAGQTVTLNVSTKTTSSITFTVSDVALAGYEYVEGVTSVTVCKP